MFLLVKHMVGIVHEWHHPTRTLCFPTNQSVEQFIQGCHDFNKVPKIIHLMKGECPEIVLFPV